MDMLKLDIKNFTFLCVATFCFLGFSFMSTISTQNFNKMINRICRNNIFDVMSKMSYISVLKASSQGRVCTVSIMGTLTAQLTELTSQQQLKFAAVSCYSCDMLSSIFPCLFEEWIQHVASSEYVHHQGLFTKKTWIGCNLDNYDCRCVCTFTIAYEWGVL